MQKTTKRLYLIPVLSKALDILELLQAENQPMTLEAVHRQTRISKTTVYRVLKTFVHRGYIAQAQDGTYRQVTRPTKMRFGFGSQSADMPFSVEVTESLKEAAANVGVDLVILDNCYDAATAIRNAEEFVRSRVDLVIEFQVEQEVAPVIADKIAAAKIPMIAIDIPHPHATYFGVDNYRVGFEAGEALAAHSVKNWGGKVDWVIGLDLPEAGQLVQSRITGAFEGVRGTIPDIPVECFVRIDCRGMRDKSKKLVSDFLQRHPKDRHILIAASNDTSALGAVDAVRQAGREKHVAILGQDCIAEAVAEMHSERSPLIGSVSHETSSYGPSLIHLGLSLLRGQHVPPYNYVDHKMVLRDTAKV
ncbi:substrate-binding domain-containing protein [Granulicella sibirica]|uniref:Periplasmic binding protein/LacI transcriptional regulator n=1 Tax=Granulicella sibirica TaxID=2479048 RepID=A0A4Q0SVV7_9BACT|nr:substrate-binding domain-containing protein [Granulicella sibirica]RXH55235.1 periplasmic binding protein/LacI transcriptional regulator [Granulicella sibirica]